VHLPYAMKFDVLTAVLLKIQAVWDVVPCWLVITGWCLKANSQMLCRAHAVPLQFSDSAVSFVKVRAVAGNIRTASPATTLYSNNLRETPRGSRKKSKAGRSLACRFWTTDANSHMLCPCCAVPWPWKVAFRTAWHGCGIACVNQTLSHCVNQMEKTQSKALEARHGMAGERHGMCELALTLNVPN
jgi:hypothetical protein